MEDGEVSEIEDSWVEWDSGKQGNYNVNSNMETEGRVLGYLEVENKLLEKMMIYVDLSTGKSI